METKENIKDTNFCFGNLNDVQVGNFDIGNEKIQDIYYSTNNMIIYQTPTKIVTTFSDDVTKFQLITEEKMEIERLLEKILSKNKNKKKEEIYKLYGPSMGSAYYFAYFDKYEAAIRTMKNIKNDIISDINNSSKYLYSCVYLNYLGVLFLGVLFVLFFQFKSSLFDCVTFLPLYFYIFFMGTVGSFLSLKRKLSAQSLNLVISPNQTRLDAFIRILLGGIFGVLLVSFVQVDLIIGVLNFEGKLLDPSSLKYKDYIMLFILALLGGYSERIIPDTLAKFEGKQYDKLKEEAEILDKAKTGNDIQKTQEETAQNQKNTKPNENDSENNSNTPNSNDGKDTTNEENEEPKKDVNDKTQNKNKGNGGVGRTSNE